MSDQKRGIYRKYFVQRLIEEQAGRDRLYLADWAGRLVKPTEKHATCRYFVLDLEHDAFAGPALRAYADACESEFPALAADLRALFPSAPAEGERLADAQEVIREMLAFDQQLDRSDWRARKRIWDRAAAIAAAPRPPSSPGPAPRCATCSRPATCLGVYEDPKSAPRYACDECCGHGQEDGACFRLPAPAPSPDPGARRWCSDPNCRRLLPEKWFNGLCAICSGWHYSTPQYQEAARAPVKDEEPAGREPT